MPRFSFTSVDNFAVIENDLWTDGIHLQKSGKRIIANNLIIFSNLQIRSGGIYEEKSFIV